MNRTILAAVAVALIGVALSCHSNKQVTEQRVEYRDTVYRDSVRVEYRERVKTLHDTVSVTIPYAVARDEVRDTVSRLETPYAWSLARIEPDGRLFHLLEMKPGALEQIVDVPEVERDTVIIHDSSQKTSDTDKTVKKEETPMSWREKLRIGLPSFLCGLATGILAVVLMILYRRHRHR